VKTITTHYCDYCHKAFSNAKSCELHEEECKARRPETARRIASGISKLMEEAKNAGIEFGYICERPEDISSTYYDVENDIIYIAPF